MRPRDHDGHHAAPGLTDETNHLVRFLWPARQPHPEGSRP